MSYGLLNISKKIPTIATIHHPMTKDRDIAMVFQSYALYPHMTVYENIAFGLKMRGLKREMYRPVDSTFGY